MMLKTIFSKVLSKANSITKLHTKVKVWYLYNKNSTLLHQCPLCDSIDFKSVRKGDRYGFPIQTLQCHSCSTGWSNPYPLQSFTDLFYQRGLYRSLYKGKAKASDLSYDNGFQKASIVNKNLSKYLQSFLCSNTKIFDYGCGAGTIASYVCDVNPAISGYGYEPGSALNSDIVRSIQIISKTSALEHTFDIITSFHVLEHTLDFVQTLKFFFDRLNKGGCIYIEVPDIERYANMSKPYHIAHSVHFSSKSFPALLQRLGYNNITQLNVDELIDSKFGMAFIAFK